MAHLPTEGLRSKAWDEFSLPGAPKLDFVFTVCDNAAKEVCPIWPGQPMTAHWGVPDPAAVRGSEAEIERAFREAFFILDRRISLFLCLPLEDSRQPGTQEGARQHRPDDDTRHAANSSVFRQRDCARSALPLTKDLQ